MTTPSQPTSYPPASLTLHCRRGGTYQWDSRRGVLWIWQSHANEWRPVLSLTPSQARKLARAMLGQEIKVSTF